jgi:hypothetical protein
MEIRHQEFSAQAYYVTCPVAFRWPPLISLDVASIMRKTSLALDLDNLSR